MKPLVPALVAAMTSLSSAGVREWTQPASCALQFDTTSYDAGDVTDAAPLEHTFRCTNVSDRTVHISRTSICGGVTTPVIAKRTFAPGESGEITLVLNPQNRKGRNVRQYPVEVDDPTCPRQVLELIANVHPLVDIDPSKIFFQEAMHGRGATQTVTVTGREPGFAVTGIDGPNGVFTAVQTKSEPVIEDGVTLTQVTLELTLAKDAPIGTHNATFVLHTTDPKAVTVNMPVAGTVVGDVRATPSGMLVRTFTPKTPFQALVQIDSRAGRAFNITNVDVEGPENMSLAVDVQPSNQNGTPVFLVTLSGTTPAAPGQYRGTITVGTDPPDDEPFRFNWIATVREQPTSATSRPGGAWKP